MEITLGLIALFFIIGNVHCHVTNIRRKERLEQIIKERTRELELALNACRGDVVKFEKVERELCSSGARQKAIFDAQPDATLISDEKGIIVMANNQIVSLLGYNTFELVGQSIEMLIPMRFRQRHPQLRESYCKAPYPRAIGKFPNVFALRKDGSEVDVEISLSPIQVEDGFLFASSLRDTTVRRQFEADLKASEERFRLMANSSPIMIWITDEKGFPTFSNQAWFNFVGLKLSDGLTHEKWRELVHPDDMKLAFTDYYKNIQAKEPISAEYRLRHESGEWRWVFDQGVPMFNDAGVFIGYIGSLIDITERKLAETELRIAAIAFESHEATVVTNANTIILRINAAFTELTGYSAEECIGQKINFFRSGHHDKAFYTEMWDVINHEGTWQGEIWDRRKNGEVYPKWLTITAVKNKVGEVTHYVGSQADITERKATEKMMCDLAYYDPLTTLPNRRLLYDRIEYSIAIAQRQKKKLAVLMLDLDRFKAVNDSFGHLAGDELLQQVALRLSACLRESDTVARLGGDEFVILLENITQLSDASLIAENVITALSTSFNLTQNENVSIGTSVGISLYPQDGDNPITLIANADAALYQAKSNGRGCFVYFSKLGLKE